MIIWIQRHDYSYEELGINTPEKAVGAFEEFDWSDEIQKGKESEEDSCSPGFGIVSDDRYVLHLCPRDSGDCLIHFHYPHKEKYLFLFARDTQKTITRENISWEDGVLLIEQMFIGNWDQMKTMI